jgi:hypothetical protein
MVKQIVAKDPDLIQKDPDPWGYLQHRKTVKQSIGKKFL